ncbi:MAG: hypothetical protein JNK15_02235 [Planctomycetes bacterium]|nr:hypothetical protein [Planctomycetota bacterium]
MTSFHRCLGAILAIAASLVAQADVVVLQTSTQPPVPVLQARPIPGVPGRFQLIDGAGRPMALRPVSGVATFVLVGTDAMPLVATGASLLVSSPAGDSFEFPGGTCEVRDLRRDGKWVLVDGATRVFPREDESIVVETAPAPADDPAVATKRDLANAAFGRGAKTSLNKLGQPLDPVLGGLLENPATINGVLQSVLDPGHGWQLLKDLELEVKTFTDDGETSLGIGFAFDRRHDLWHDGDETVWGLDYRMTARGDVAFEPEVNPQDLLEGRVSFNLFRSSGGVQRDGVDSDPTGEKFNAWAKELARYPTDEAFLASPRWSAISELAQSRFSTQVCLEVGLDVGFESDQDVAARHFVVGAHAVLDVKAWQRASLGAWLNLADHPFAVVRCLSGYDAEFAPRGSTIPTVLIGFDRLEPEGDDPRAGVGDRDGFERLRAEVGFKTPVARRDQQEYFFVANWRYFREIGAPRAVEAAGLDEYDFVYLAVESQNGLFVSYNQGQLPFGVADREFFEVGWKFGF